MRQTGLIFGWMQTRRRHWKRRKADATSILATHVGDEHPSRWHAKAPSKVREKSKYTALVEEEDEVGAKQFCEVSGKSSTLLNCSGMYCECYSIINFSYIWYLYCTGCHRKYKWSNWPCWRQRTVEGGMLQLLGLHKEWYMIRRYMHIIMQTKVACDTWLWLLCCMHARLKLVMYTSCQEIYKLYVY